MKAKYSMEVHILTKKQDDTLEIIELEYSNKKEALSDFSFYKKRYKKVSIRLFENFEHHNTCLKSWDA